MQFTRRHYISLLTAGLATAAAKSLLAHWFEIASTSDGKIGAAALNFETGESVALNASRSYPLASVCKLPIAIRILAMADEQKLHLSDEIEILPQDVWHSWQGDIGESWPRQQRWKLDDLLRAMVVHSDNTAVHTLFRLAGGPTAMAACFREWNVSGMRLDRYEGECYLASHGIDPGPPFEQWRPGLLAQLVKNVPLSFQQAGMRKFLTDPRDTATPDGTVQLLARLYRGELLHASSTAYLKSALAASTPGPDRLKGLLPPNTTVAHKTGTTATVAGLNGSTNDVGVIDLPRNQGPFAIAVYVSGSSRDESARANVIARIARATYDEWSS